MKRALLWITGILVLGILVFIVGPFTFWASVIPHLSPVLPKPDGVPDHARAEYHWKGFGMSWNWDDELENGCLRWMAAESAGQPVRIIDLFDEAGGCTGQRALMRYSFSDKNIYGQGGNDWPYEECPFTLTEEQLASYRAILLAVRDSNQGIEETNLLNAAIADIDLTSGHMLRARQFGCSRPSGQEIEEVETAA